MLGAEEFEDGDDGVGAVPLHERLVVRGEMVVSPGLGPAETGQAADRVGDLVGDPAVEGPGVEAEGGVDLERLSLVVGDEGALHGAQPSEGGGVAVRGPAGQLDDLPQRGHGGNARPRGLEAVQDVPLGVGVGDGRPQIGDEQTEADQFGEERGDPFAPRPGKPLRQLVGQGRERDGGGGRRESQDVREGSGVAYAYRAAVGGVAVHTGRGQDDPVAHLPGQGIDGDPETVQDLRVLLQPPYEGEQPAHVGPYAGGGERGVAERRGGAVAEGAEADSGEGPEGGRPGAHPREVTERTRVHAPVLPCLPPVPGVSGPDRRAVRSRPRPAHGAPVGRRPGTAAGRG
ncbi:hypothetical protein RB196_16345 [Streptomyces sp. PmtA]